MQNVLVVANEYVHVPVICSINSYLLDLSFGSFDFLALFSRYITMEEKKVEPSISKLHTQLCTVFVCLF